MWKPWRGDRAQCFYSTMGLRNTLLLWCWITHKIVWQLGHIKSLYWLLHLSGVSLFTEPLLDCVNHVFEVACKIEATIEHRHNLVGARGWQIPLQYFFYLRIVVFWLLSPRGANKIRNVFKMIIWVVKGRKQMQNQNRGIRVPNTCGRFYPALIINQSVWMLLRNWTTVADVQSILLQVLTVVIWNFACGLHMIVIQ